MIWKLFSNGECQRLSFTILPVLIVIDKVFHLPLRWSVCRHIPCLDRHQFLLEGFERFFSNSFLLTLLQVLVTVDLDRQRLLFEVIKKELGNAINTMVLLVIDLRVLLATLMYFRGIFCVIHIEFVFTENVGAEVLWQLCNAVNFNLEVESLVEKVFRLDIIVKILQL